jgi:hypothetical protein
VLITSNRTPLLRGKTRVEFLSSRPLSHPNISVRDYLGSVLPVLANFPINRIAELTPVAWAAEV